MTGYWIGPEEVRGTIIGGEEKPYKFFRLTDDRTGKKGEQIGYRFEYFDTDEEAIAWWKENHPEYAGITVEMRCYE